MDLKANQLQRAARFAAVLRRALPARLVLATALIFDARFAGLTDFTGFTDFTDFTDITDLTDCAFVL